jgi:DNA-binding NtrC family response regulator
MAALAAWLRDVRVRCAELEQLVAGLRDGSVLVGRSPVMRRLGDALRRAADNDATLLIEGQTGTGKSLAARVVHCKSRRCGLPLVTAEGETVDAEALTKLLEESSNTTMIIENVDRLPAASQAVLVRHLKERARASTGTLRPRVIATSSNHLPELVARGAFREDLYYRLNVFPLRMPALRERTEDIGLLAQTFLQPGGASRAGFTASALILLESMPWPGNVAQLESTIRRAAVLAGGAPIDRTHLLGPTTGVNAPLEAKVESTSTEEQGVTEEMIRPFEEEEQLLLARALRATGGNVRRAAQLLGIGRATLYRKIQQYRLRLH